MANNVEEGGKLSHLFDEIWAMHEKLENSTDPSTSDTVQVLVQRSIDETEKAVCMVNELALYATNEDVEEIATSDLRYMLLPALLGYFINKNTKLDRFDVVQKSQIYLLDFIKLCKLYGLTDAEVPKPCSPSDGDQLSTTSKLHSERSRSTDVEQQGRQRQEKIARFRRRKQLEESLQELRLHATRDNTDEEITRKYYLTMIDRWLSDAFDSLDSIAVELPILEHMSKMTDKRSAEKQSTLDEKPTRDKPIMRPFIITKNDLQKAVFGLGYPSIPTVTVDEFYTQRVEEGTFPSPHCTDSHHHGTVKGHGDHGGAEADGQRDDEAVSKDDEDDDEDVQKARAWDDWKDDHRRGWGNTHNKG